MIFFGLIDFFNKLEFLLTSRCFYVVQKSSFSALPERSSNAEHHRLYAATSPGVKLPARWRCEDSDVRRRRRSGRRGRHGGSACVRGVQLCQKICQQLAHLVGNTSRQLVFARAPVGCQHFGLQQGRLEDQLEGQMAHASHTGHCWSGFLLFHHFVSVPDRRPAAAVQEKHKNKGKKNVCSEHNTTFDAKPLF